LIFDWQMRHLFRVRAWQLAVAVAIVGLGWMANRAYLDREEGRFLENERARQQAWREFVWEDAGVAALLPGVPEYEEHVADAKGMAVTTRSYSGSVDGASYFVNFTQFPSGTDSTQTASNLSAEFVRRGYLPEKVAAHDLSIAGYPAAELRLLKGGHRNTRVRFVYVDRCMYALSIVGELKHMDSALATRFFDSFRLLSEEHDE
jgi:hypothetical protein